MNTTNKRTTLIERLKDKSEARTAELYREKDNDEKIEDKTFGYTQAVAWDAAGTHDTR